MNPTTRPGAALLLAATLSSFVSFALLPRATRAQGPSGAGAGVGPDATTQTYRTPSASPGESPAGPPAQAPAVAIAAAAPAKPTLADLAWLAGSWQGTWGPRAAQQVWATPGAGVMLGTFQIAENDKTLVIELFTLAETPDGVELRIRHFTPSLVPWEKDGPTVLRLVSADAKSAVFENPVNGEPKTQFFRRVDMDTYISRSEVVPPEGNPQVAEIKFHRARAEAAASKRKATKKSE